MRRRLALGACCLIVSATLTAGGERSALPSGMPWLSLVHDSGLAPRPDRGLVVAVWRDGSIVKQRDPKSRVKGAVQIGRLSSASIQQVEAAIRNSGLWIRPSAPRYPDAAEDGLLIRQDGAARCWFDSGPLATTRGLREVADVVLALPLERASNATLSADDWLPWSHYREPSCE
jgi:hypothetical protein